MPARYPLQSLPGCFAYFSDPDGLLRAPFIVVMRDSLIG